MSDAARDNLVFIIAMLSVLVFAGGAALFTVGLILLHRDDEPAPKPKAARTNPTLTGRAVTHATPKAPEPAIFLPPPIVPVYQPGIQPVPDVGDPTRLDLMSEHVARSRRRL